MQQKGQVLRRVKIALITLAAGMVAIGIFYGGFWSGATRYAVNITNSRELINADFSLFWEAIDLVKRRYVNAADVKDEQLLYGAIHGAVGALNDPYSAFFEPSDAEKFEQDLTGSFGGIGAQLGIQDAQLVIVSPLKGNPAEAAGLKARDKILQIDNASTNGMTIEAAVKLIRGEFGTKVRLLILRDGWKEAKEFQLTRGTIIVPTLDWKMLDGKIAHFQIYNFNANLPALFYQASLEALLQGARGIVLDLRNNPGGYFDMATYVSGWFLNRGDVIVKERFHGGDELPFRASGNAAFADIPVVVLVNGGSASASEIVAGALRDNRRATLVGEKTFGKGTVQEIEQMKNGSVLKISIAEWVTPNGTKIDRQGLQPDVVVEAPKEETKGDPQLEKALEALRAKMK